MENLQGGTLALEHHYHLNRQAHSFGMVTVYEATQDPFAHPVRVAVYGGLLEAGATPAVVERIKASATMASRLRGTGVLPVLDFGEIEAGVPFVIERASQGTTLADLLRREDVISPRRALHLVARLTEILETAHRQGIFHGNLRPEWILIPDEGDLEDAELSHFGLSLSMAELVTTSQAVLTTDLVDAFAPECFDVTARDQQGENGATHDREAPHLTAQADQWALAALVYRLLVGVHPYFDDPVDASEGILRIKTEAPASLKDLGIDASIATVIDRALSPAPGDRFPTLESFHQALHEAISDQPLESGTHAPSPSPTPQPKAATEQPSEFTEDDRAYPGPRPSGYLLTVALAALLLSNLGWFFLTMAEPDLDDELVQETTAEAAPSPGTLPTGLQLETSPSDAEIVLVASDEEGGEEILGSTPMVVPDSLFGESPRSMVLRHQGFHDQQLTIAEDRRGQSVRIYLLSEDLSQE